MSYEVLARPLRVAILTVSDTRTFETDKGGNKVQEFLEQADHIVADRKIVIDDYNEIRNAMIPWCNDESIDVIISTGGTGIAKRDVTIEAANSLYEKHIPGFGEIFRYLSNNTLMFSVPGSVGAVTLAMGKLIIPEMAHLVREITK